MKDMLRNQFGTNISWSRVAALKHNKSKNKKQRVTDSFHITPNHYKLLGNDSNDDDDGDDDTPAKTDRLSKSTINYIRCDKKKAS